MTAFTVDPSRTLDPHGIGWAVSMMKRGFKVRRTAWPAGVHLWLKPPAEIQESWCHDPDLKALCHANGGSIIGTGTVCMLTEDIQVVTGWLASQVDLLADDWEVLQGPVTVEASE